MKRILLVLLLLSQLTAARAALAVTVNFGTLGGNTIDITSTINPAGLLLDGVTFRYDVIDNNQVFDNNEVIISEGIDAFNNQISASVDLAGIYGSTYGMLIFEWIKPVTALSFDFSLARESTGLDEALFATLKIGGTEVGDFNASTIFNSDQGIDLGTFAYNGATFDQALFFFSSDDPFFTVSNVSYEPVPEPGTIMLLSAGLFGLAVYGRRRMES